jgi:hypothetical protein
MNVRREMKVVRSLALVAGLAVVAASCGLPTGDGAPSRGDTSDLAAECGPVPLDWPVGDLDAAFDPFEGDIEALVDDSARVEFDLSPLVRWSVVEQTSRELLLFGQSESLTAGGPEYRYAMFELDDGDWRAVGWGGCRIQATAEGFGVATFELDRDNPPESADTTLHLLATERACASGKAPAGREARPYVVETSDAVEIIVLVEEQTVDAGRVVTCPGNPAFPIAVELDSPLGDRMTRDGGMYPVEDRPWPPPPPSPELWLDTVGEAPDLGRANVVAWDGDPSGGLLFQDDGWWRDRRLFAGFTSNYPTRITGFVTECGSSTQCVQGWQGCGSSMQCVQECRGAACDALPRLGVECSISYTPTPGENTTITVIFAGTTCTIESKKL